jgi:hypothetical protein
LAKFLFFAKKAQKHNPAHAGLNYLFFGNLGNNERLGWIEKYPIFFRHEVAF